MKAFDNLKQRWKNYQERKRLKREVLQKMYNDLQSCEPGSEKMEVQANAIDKVRGKEDAKAAWIQGGLAFCGVVIAAIIKALFLRGNMIEGFKFEEGDHLVGSEPGKAALRDALKHR